MLNEYIQMVKLTIFVVESTAKEKKKKKLLGIDKEDLANLSWAQITPLCFSSTNTCSLEMWHNLKREINRFSDGLRCTAQKH